MGGITIWGQRNNLWGRKPHHSEGKTQYFARKKKMRKARLEGRVIKKPADMADRKVGLVHKQPVTLKAETLGEECKG